jgi:hypothetical protein
MTKVGILTMHRVLNYGSVLQAFATQYVINKLGFNCEIIDYQYPNIFQFEHGVNFIPMSLKSKIAKKIWLKKRWRKINKFELFYKKYLHLSCFYDSPYSIKKNPPLYDIYMTGSDQVWNPRFTKGDTTFLLDFIKDKKKISYASSFACDHLDNAYVGAFKSLLQEYSNISVREDGGKKIIKELLNIDVPVVLDPTLLISLEDWMSISKNRFYGRYKNKKYILVYMLNYAFDPTSIIYKVINKIHKDYSLEIISIGKLNDKLIPEYKSIEAAGPIEFLNLFLGASCIITSSFHGTAFALNFEKPLFSISDTNMNNDDRQISLLKHLNLYNCIVNKNSNIEDLTIENNVTSGAKYLIEDMRKSSLAYLKKVLL